MRVFVVGAALVILTLTAHAGGACRSTSCGVLPPLYGGGYTPLDCAATVLPAPRRCHCWGPRRTGSIVRRARAVHRACHAGL